MGRLRNDDPPASSSHSLHTLHDEDQPPPYTDEPQIDFNINVSASQPAPGYRPLRLIDSAYVLPGAKGTTVCDTRVVTLEPSLSHDSAELFQVIRRQIKLPLRPLLRIQGTHTESSNDGKKKSRNTVTDFFFQLDLAETLLTGWNGAPLTINWVEETVVRDGDGIPAFRGSRYRTRSYKSPALRSLRLAGDSSDAALLDAETGAAGEDQNDATALLDTEADLKLWCERYCNDPSPVKSFTLRRELHGFDYNIMRNVLSSHIKSLNYLGSTNFWLVKGHSTVTIYSPHWINRIRTNRFLWWLFVILQLWIITWPVIWFMEKRYEIAGTRWNASLDPGSETGLVKCYAQDRDETALAEFWAPAVMQAAWTRRQGEGSFLTRLDAERLQGLSRDELLGIGGREDSAAERERRERVNRGEGGFVDGVVGLVRGVSEMRQDWRLTMGWGGNC